MFYKVAWKKLLMSLHWVDIMHLYVLSVPATDSRACCKGQRQCWLQHQ